MMILSLRSHAAGCALAVLCLAPDAVAAQSAGTAPSDALGFGGLVGHASVDRPGASGGSIFSVILRGRRSARFELSPAFTLLRGREANTTANLAVELRALGSVQTGQLRLSAGPSLGLAVVEVLEDSDVESLIGGVVAAEFFVGPRFGIRGEARAAGYNGFSNGTTAWLVGVTYQFGS